MPVPAIAVIGALIAYVLGGFPSGVVIGKVFFGVDVREHGSHNIGMTNTVRTLGWGPGIVVFLLDVLKGAIGVFIMMYLVGRFAPDVSQNVNDLLLVLAALGALLGHMKSPFLHFTGGKGVSTGLGVFLAFLPAPGLTAFAGFLIVAFSTRIVSLGTLTAAAIAPLATMFFKWGHPVDIVFAFLVSAFVVWAHRGNIERLKNGTEPKLKAGKRPEKKEG